MSRRIDRIAIALLVGCLTAAGARASERSYPLDCLPDRVVEWAPVAANPAVLFGAAWVPGILLGPPGDSQPLEGSFAVAALGFGGVATVAFDTIVIEDGPGPDFIVFENAFFRLPLPATDADDFRIFAEPGIVEVSEDGVSWSRFPYDAQALASATGQDLDMAQYESLVGLAGLTPTFTGNWTVPDDPLVFDTGGVGGISGAGGDAFDLATVGLAEARYVRILDADTENGFPGPGEGFDLDAVVALHARPDAPNSADADGDRLSDREELLLYGSNPAVADSDGDGVDDGREIAACRDPSSSAIGARFHGEPRVWVLGKSCTELRWSFAGTGVRYDVLRGDPALLADLGAEVDLGTTVCLEDDEINLRWSCDAESLPPGGAFFYLVRVDGAPDLGRGSGLSPRAAAGRCP